MTQENTQKMSEEQATEQMWDALEELAFLEYPLKPDEEDANAHYYPGEMAGSEQEIEGAKEKLIDAVLSGADVETLCDEKDVLSWVVDENILESLLALGVPKGNALVWHKGKAAFEKERSQHTKTAASRAYHTDLYHIHQKMADVLSDIAREEVALDVYFDLFDEEHGCFILVENEVFQTVKLKRPLTQEEKKRIVSAVSFFVMELDEVPELPQGLNADAETPEEFCLWLEKMISTVPTNSLRQAQTDTFLGNMFNQVFHNYNDVIEDMSEEDFWDGEGEINDN
ncbi:MAG: hypothetical protein IJC30_03055 [Alphaproteobacteria bacterium]|nr:hypothetical protein [Alphaproteobacteria bacterium]